MNLAELFKIGSAPPAATAASTPSTSIAEAAKAAIDAVGQSKTASAATPATDLEKLAQDVANKNREGELAHAKALGEAMFDGFLSKAASFEQAVNAVSQEKTAAANLTQAELDLIEGFRNDPYGTAVKVAEWGAAMEAESKAETHRATIEWIHKNACEHFAAGYEALDTALKASA